MNKTLLIAALAASIGFACGEANVNSTNAVARAEPTPVPTASIPKDGNYNGKGVVTKIDMKLGSVELNHEDIPGVMAAMKMEFYVIDKSLLNGLKIGDKVDFVLEYKHPAETIVEIKKIQ
jgi:Cu/Ag efflux protein CusF